MAENTKIVDFHYWCPKCVHETTKEDEDPCYDCLATGGNNDSTKPISFKSKHGGEKHENR